MRSFVRSFNYKNKESFVSTATFIDVSELSRRFRLAFLERDDNNDAFLEGHFSL